MPKMPEAELPLPKFESEEEEAQYWETHSVASIWQKLPRGKAAPLLPSLSRGIRERQVARKAAVSVRLDPDQIEKVKEIAARKSIDYRAQLQLWITEGIQREHGRSRPRSRASRP
jgi:hypothetical protein